MLILNNNNNRSVNPEKLTFSPLNKHSPTPSPFKHVALPSVRAPLKQGKEDMTQKC